MRTKGWLVLALVVSGLVFAYRGCLNELDPDQRLAGHLQAMCEIARDHIPAPEKGVRKLGAYLVKHGGAITGELGSTLATIERIQDDEYHDERAMIARDRIHKPLRACERDWARFAQAVDADPRASAAVERALRRLNRTLEILFGGRRHVPLRDWPRELVRAFG
jgi:hypothetical protein